MFQIKNISSKFNETNELRIASDVIDKEIEGLVAVKSVLDNKFIKIIEILYNAKGRIVTTGLGKSGLIAKKFAATLASTGTPSMFIHPVEALHGDLGMITHDDAVVFLSNSGESNELSQIIEYCKRFDIPAIGMCRNSNSSMVKNCDITLVLPNIAEATKLPAPTTSTTMMLAISDAIAVVLSERKGFTKTDFQSFHPGGSIGAQLTKLKELMHVGNELPLINIKATMTDAILEITKKRFGCVGILNDAQQLIGIITNGDLGRNIDKDHRVTLAKDIMSKNPITTSGDMFAAEALYLLNSKKITVCFIIDMDSKPVGIIHMHDLLKAKVA